MRTRLDVPARREKKVRGLLTAAATREVVVRDEIDKAFRKHGSRLSEIEIVFPDGRAGRRS